MKPLERVKDPRLVLGRDPRAGVLDLEAHGTAGGLAGRRYPWGNDAPDVTRANYKESGKEDAVAVGSFPAGRTPEGVYDLAGNVSEWTRSFYAPYPYVPEARRESLEGGGTRVYRGGLFASDAFYVRGAYRGTLDAASRVGSNGLRVVLTGPVRQP